MSASVDEVKPVCLEAPADSIDKEIIIGVAASKNRVSRNHFPPAVLMKSSELLWITFDLPNSSKINIRDVYTLVSS